LPFDSALKRDHAIGHLHLYGLRHQRVPFQVVRRRVRDILIRSDCRGGRVDFDFACDRLDFGDAHCGALGSIFVPDAVNMTVEFDNAVLHGHADPLAVNAGVPTQFLLNITLQICIVLHKKPL
jgi:hypothetical protein